MKYNSIGKQIKQYRSLNNLTQQQLADKIGVTWEMISRYERGTSSAMQKIEQLAKALKIHPAELLKDKTQPLSKSYIITEENVLPMFFQRPEGDKFNRENTQYSQNAPDWIIKIDRNCFVIDPVILSDMNTRITKAGPIYISPFTEHKPGCLVLADIKGKLVIQSVEQVGRSNKIFGVVICQEVKLV